MHCKTAPSIGFSEESNTQHLFQKGNRFNKESPIERNLYAVCLGNWWKWILMNIRFTFPWCHSHCISYLILLNETKLALFVSILKLLDHARDQKFQFWNYKWVREKNEIVQDGMKRDTERTSEWSPHFKNFTLFEFWKPLTILFHTEDIIQFVMPKFSKSQLLWSDQWVAGWSCHFG